MLTSKGISSPSNSDVADEMRLPLLQYQQLRSALKGLQLTSLQVERDGETGREQELDLLQAMHTEDPLFCCIKGEIRDKLSAAIDALPEKSDSCSTCTTRRTQYERDF